MSRIHKILSKAERDGTAARVTWPERQGQATDPTLTVPRAWRGGVVADRPVDGAETFDDEAPGEQADGLPADGHSAGLEGAPLLGIAAAEAAKLGHPVPRTHTVGAPARPATGVTLSPLLVTSHQPLSPGAEQYRSLRTRLTRREGGDAHKVLAVTSPCRGDGKSVTAANLALAMAQEFDRRALLIDADLRNASIHQLFGIERQPGLVDILTGAAPIEAALVALPGSRLVVLPAGGAHTQPTELLGSVQMRQLLEILRRQFDRIVVDAASALTADTGALQAAVDGVLVVVRAGRTPRPAIERTLQSIPAPKMTGLILNDSRSLDALSNG